MALTDDFGGARDATDLIPGDVRTVAAIGNQLVDSAVPLDNVVTTVAATTQTLPWSGPAADAFSNHRRSVLDQADQWQDALHTVLDALDHHQAALTTARDTAGRALTLWTTAHDQAAQSRRFPAVDSPASNAEIVQAHMRADLASAKDRANTLLTQARADLDNAGNTAADVVNRATEKLRQAALPPLRSSGRTVTVQPPHEGVHDTLSRIAARTLGDANRWPEIYHLNVGHTVGDHAVLHNPNLIQPGWTLRLPADHAPAEAPVNAPHTGHAPIDPHPESDGGPAGHHVVPGAPRPTPPIPAPHRALPTPPVDGGGDHGVDLGGGLVLAGGIAAALAGVAITAGIRRRYNSARVLDTTGEPGPLVTPLDTAVDRHVGESTSAERPVAVPLAADVPLGHHDGRTVLVDAATTLGLGLTGPGAAATGRALLISVLASDPTAAALLTTEAQNRLLDSPPQSVDGRVTVLDTPEEVLDRVEAEILTRTRMIEQTTGQYTPAPLIVLMAPPDDTRRLQAVADLGAGLGIIVIILGPWPAGITCLTGADGRIHEVHGAQASGWARSLPGLRVFTAGIDDTHTLLSLLGASLVPAPRTDPDPPSAQPDDEAGEVVPGRIAQLLNPEPCAPETAIVSPAPETACAVTNPVQRRSDQSAPTAVRLNVLGRVELTTHVDGEPIDITSALAPKQREILIYLALHRDGVRREVLAAALWPDASPDRPYNSFHATLSQTRRSLRRATHNAVDNLTTNHDGYYSLRPDLVDVDLWHLNDALHANHFTDVESRVDALRQVPQLYRGELAESLHATWLEAPREALRREVLDALSTLIHTIRDTEMDQTLALLEQAREIDPHNEAIYRDIMRTQSKLGHHDAVPRTLELLNTALREIDTTPSPDTRTLAAQLSRRQQSTQGPTPVSR